MPFRKSSIRVDRVVQVEGIHVAAVDVNLPLQLRTQRLPVAFQDVAEIVVFAPVLGDGMVDLAGVSLSQMRFG